MSKKVEYRPYDTVKILAVDLPEVNGKISLPDAFRGKEATVDLLRFTSEPSKE